jgi:hypothetical protein
LPLDIETEIEELKNENEYLREKLKMAEAKLRNALAENMGLKAQVKALS